MTKELNRRLTTTDATFLYTEKPTQPMHIGSCNVYEGRVGREDLLNVIRDRIHLIPRYRQRVMFSPFNAAHPTWEDDPRFDVENHVEEITLPEPADDRTLSMVGGRLFGQVLDRSRPLWKLILLQGHATRGTVMLSMVHHAMVDGISGVELQMVLHDLTAKADPPAPPAEPWKPRPLPDFMSLWQDAIRDRMMENARRWTDETFTWLRREEAEERTRQVTAAMTTSFPAMLQPAPPTPFNGPLSAEREFAWLELSFAEIRAIRSALGGTVNDVVLTVLAGGLGRYLRLHGYPTRNVELRAMCPVSMRRENQRGALGNLVSMILAPLYVGIDDPVERLAAEREGMERLKEQDQPGGLFAITQSADAIPPAMQAFSLSMTVPNTMLNTVSTNVPGPQIPLYLAGHKLDGWYPMGPCATGIGLFNAVLSYNQKLTFGATVDPRLVPDVWTFIDCLRESFDEVLAAATRAAPAISETTSAAPSAALPAAVPAGPPAAVGARSPRRERRAPATVS